MCLSFNTEIYIGVRHLGLVFQYKCFLVFNKTNVETNNESFLKEMGADPGWMQ